MLSCGDLCDYLQGHCSGYGIHGAEVSESVLCFCGGGDLHCNDLLGDVLKSGGLTCGGLHDDEHDHAGLHGDGDKQDHDGLHGDENELHRGGHHRGELSCRGLCDDRTCCGCPCIGEKYSGGLHGDTWVCGDVHGDGSDWCDYGPCAAGGDLGSCILHGDGSVYEKMQRRDAEASEATSGIFSNK